MSGLNSLSGLNNVNVDFRPTVELIKSKPDKSNQPLPEANVVPENAPRISLWMGRCTTRPSGRTGASSA